MLRKMDQGLRTLGLQTWGQSLSPQNTCNKPMAVNACNLRTERWRKASSGGSLDNLLKQQASGERTPLPRNNTESDREHPASFSALGVLVHRHTHHIHMCMHTSPPTHTPQTNSLFRKNNQGYFFITVLNQTSTAPWQYNNPNVELHNDGCWSIKKGYPDY